MQAFEFDSKFGTFLPKCLFSKNLKWMIFLATCLLGICLGGLRRCFSVFLTEIHSDNNGTVSQTELNWLGDTHISFSLLLLPFTTAAVVATNKAYRTCMTIAMILLFTGCLATSLVPYYGTMFLTHSVITSVGSALATGVATIILGEYFESKHRYHVMATSLLSGGPLGAVIFCPIFALLTEAYGWRLILRGVAFIIVFLCIFAILVFVHKSHLPSSQGYQDMDSMVDEEKDTVNKEEEDPILTARRFTLISKSDFIDKPLLSLWLTERAIFSLITYSLAMNLQDYEMEKQIELGTKKPLVVASQLQLSFTIGESIFFIIFTLLGDRFRGSLSGIHLCRSVVLPFMLVTWQLVQHNPTVEILFAVLCGACFGVGNSFIYAVSEEVTGIQGSISFPAAHMAAGFGALFAPLVSGKVADFIGYRFFFLIQSFLSCVVTLLMSIICWKIYKSTKFPLDEVKPKEDHKELQQNTEDSVIENIKRNRYR